MGEDEVNEEVEDAEESASEDEASEAEEGQEVRTETDPVTGEEQEVDDAGQVVPVPTEGREEIVVGDDEEDDEEEE